MSNIQQLFIVQLLDYGFVLLNFADLNTTNFNRCITALRKNKLMQENLFFDFEAVTSQIPSFPPNLTIVQPSNPTTFDKWNLITFVGDSIFAQENNKEYCDLQQLAGTKGKRMAFLLTKVGGEALSLGVG